MANDTSDKRKLLRAFALSISVVIPHTSYSTSLFDIDPVTLWPRRCPPYCGDLTPSSPKSQLLAPTGGAILEQWITVSRNSMLNDAMPIPLQIRRALTGYATEDSMNRVRYKIGDKEFLNLVSIMERGGFASAVTLIDVIVFRGRAEANDPSVWAHELKHVDQFREWGVHSFAIQYARDYRSVEAPAYDVGNGYRVWAQSQNISTPSTTSVDPVQSGMGRFCITTYARDIGQLYPVGSACTNAIDPNYQFTPGAPRVMGVVAPGP